MNSKYKVNGEGWEFNFDRYRVIIGTTCAAIRSNKKDIEEYVSTLSAPAIWTVEQRYSDKQMELEKDGWIIGKWDKSPTTGNLLVEIFDETLEELGLGFSNASVWEDAIAYRPANNDLYHNGERVALREGGYLSLASLDFYNIVRAVGSFDLSGFDHLCTMLVSNVKSNYLLANESGALIESNACGKRLLTLAQVLNPENAKGDKSDFPDALSYKSFSEYVGEPQDHENDTPEPEVSWNGEGLPDVGVWCLMWDGYCDRKVCLTYVGNGVGCYKLENGKEYTIAFNSVRFNPIQSHRDKVIEKARAEIDSQWDMNLQSAATQDTVDTVINDLYDANMLTLPPNKTEETK